MRLTPLGIRELVVSTILACVAAGMLSWAAVCVSAWCWAPVGLVGVIWLWVLWFFRDPARMPPEWDGLFVSPADGVVSDITPLGDESELGCAGVRIGVFMNVFNVHVNRLPCDGRVVEVTHRSGAFLDVRRPEAAEKNESASIRLTHRRNGNEYPVIVRQIAGLIARRIVTNLTPGQDVKRGERFGMIKWGSRLEVLLPSELQGQVRVRIGQRTLAGETVIFRAEDEE
ncbi:MAG: phosphatidylserine decarboxylase family protein [Phycisphaerae bacterium]|nr:phosphatidylserine decarboxylase family protein [Phycisphaerae bacterium]